MKKGLKISLIVFILLAAIVALVPLFMPAEYHIERKAEINAPVEIIFNQVNHLPNWEGWEPWGAKDPTNKNEYSDPASGTDAWRSWKGEQTGEGLSTILNSEANKQIDMEIEFKGMGPPMKTSFSFEPNGETTTVTWTADGTSNYPMNAMNPMMEKYIGQDYDEGLKNLQKVAEGFADWGIREMDYEPQPMLSTTREFSMSDIQQNLGEMYGLIGTYAAKNGIQMAGMPFAIYHNFNEENMRVEAGLPISEPAEGDERSGVNAGFMPGGKSLTIVHEGAYENFSDSYEKMDKWIEMMGYEKNGPYLEHYLTDPGEVSDPSQNRTEIRIQVK